MFEEPAYQWRDPEWRRAAEGWIHETAARLGNPIVGPIEGIRFLPWSAVLRAPGASGDLFFKACGPSQAHEPALAAMLAAARPDCMIPVLATDLERGWMLMPDGGPTLTPSIPTPEDGPPHWRRVLRAIAGVQKDLIPSTTALLAIGVPDRRPAALPQLLDELLSDPHQLLAGESGAIDPAGLTRLSALKPRIVDLCAELAGIGPPGMYVQDDLHEDHIFTRRDSNGSWHYTFFDFGDAIVAHPFFQLVSQPRFISQRFAADDDPVKLSLYEDYIEHWVAFAPAERLHRARRVANALGGGARALTWTNACGNVLDELSPELRGFYKEGTAFWLRQVVVRVERLENE